MKNTIFISIGTALLLLYSMSGFSQNEKFRSKTIEDGLANNWVNCFVQDKQGFIWIGTDDGLSRFDGYQFANFRHNPEKKNSIGGNSINSLACDNQGNIWISCTGSGLYKYSHTHDTFEKMTFSDAKFSTLNITILFHSSLGKIWIGTSTGDLACFDPVKNTIYLDNLGTYEDNAEILTIVEDKNNNIWLGTSVGLFRYFPREKRLEKVTQPFASGYMRPVFKNHGHNVCFYNSNNEIYMYDEKKQEYKLLWERPGDLPHIVTTILPGNKGELWLACDNGLMKLIKQPDGKYKLSYAGEEKYFKLPVKSMYKDNMDNLWIGLWRRGILYTKLNKNSSGFVHILPDPEDPYSKAKIVRCLLPKENTVIAGTDWGGVFQLNTRQVYSNASNSGEKLSNIPFKLITGLANGPGGRLLIGSFGLYEYDYQLQTITNHYFKTQDNNNIFYANFLNGNRVLFTILDNIYFMDLKTREITRTLDISEYSSGQIFTLAFENKNIIWIGLTNGLVRLHLDNLDHTEYRHSNIIENSLSNNTIHCIKPDQKGRVWIGTRNGLNLYNRPKDNFIVFNEQNGLPNSFIHAIEEDRHGDLWITTNKGLSRFSVAGLTLKALEKKDPSGLFTNYDQSDGLQGNQFCRGSSCKTKSGILAFGGINGISLFHPDSIKIKTDTLHVNLTGLQLFNKEVPIAPGNKNSILNKHVNETNGLVLSHQQNFINIDYVALHYPAPETVEYAYILEGLDHGWNYVKDQKSANYTNLPPGEYTFRVKASIKGRNWGAPEKTLKIKVLPPWWNTAWFRLLSIIVFIGAIYLIYRMRIRGLKIRQRELEDKVARRTNDLNALNRKLEDQARTLQEKNENLQMSQQKILEQNEEITHQKENLENQNKTLVKKNEEIIRITNKLHESDQIRFRFFTNISHEFRTPLTLIINPLESILKNEKLNEKLKEKISLVFNNASRLLNLINQLLEFRKTENETSELKPGHLDIVDTVRGVYESFRLSADKKNMEYVFYSERERLMAWFDPDKLEKIMFNLLSNAFKYTPDNGKITVELTNGKDESYKIKITDTGKGIDKEKLDKIFNRFYQATGETGMHDSSGIGLSLTKLLVDMHGGDIEVDSCSGKGTCFTVTMPVKLENQAVPVEPPPLPEEYTSEIYSTGEYEQGPPGEKTEMQGAKLLIVEDNDDLRKFLGDELADFYDILDARDGKEGLETAIRELPDLIISDIMMPGMNGYELCKQVKMEWQTNHIPVVLLTAKTNKQSLVQAIEFGADAYMGKPFDMLHLKKQIYNLLVNRKTLFEKYNKGAAVYSNNGLNQGNREFIEKIDDVINENLSNKQFNVEILAKKMHTSRSVLYKKVLEITNVSIGELIRIKRLKEAAGLIHENKYNISEIADMVGFSERPAFSRSFNKFFGMSPKQYQKKYLDKK